MAQQNINYGAAPNDGTGDTLRDAMIKVQENFSDLYALSDDYLAPLEQAQTDIRTLRTRLDVSINDDGSIKDGSVAFSDLAQAVQSTISNAATTASNADTKASTAISNAATNTSAINALTGRVGTNEAAITALQSVTVNTINGIRKLTKTGYRFARTLGYSSVIGRGSSFYYRDDADTASTDDACTVLVAEDGGRWKLNHNGTIHLYQAGGVADSATADTTALQRLINCAAKVGATADLGVGGILVDNTITIPQTEFTLIGRGAGTKLIHSFDAPLFAGVSTAIASYHRFGNFRIISKGAKNGTAYCFSYPKGIVRSCWRDIEISPQLDADGKSTGNEPFGLISSPIDQTWDTLVFDNVVLNLIVGIGYNVPKGSGLWYVGGRVVGLNELTSGATGILLNGGMGGVWVIGTDLIKLDTGLWTTSNNGSSNREIFLTQGCADSCARFGFRFSDNSYISWSGAWASSCETANVQVDNTFKGILNMVGGTIFNAGGYNGSSLKDGLVINSARRVLISGVHIRENKGYGLRCVTNNIDSLTVGGGTLISDNGSNSIGGQKVRFDGVDFENNTNAPQVISAVGSTRITNTTGIDDILNVATPAVPASGTAITYSGYVPCMVYLNGGTVSLVRRNGAGLFTTSNVSFQIAPGDTITLTYTAAPTWAFLAMDA